MWTSPINKSTELSGPSRLLITLRFHSRVPCMASMARGSMRTCMVSGWDTPYPVRAKPRFMIQDRDVYLVLTMSCCFTSSSKDLSFSPLLFGQKSTLHEVLHPQICKFFMYYTVKVRSYILQDQQSGIFVIRLLTCAQPDRQEESRGDGQHRHQDQSPHLPQGGGRDEKRVIVKYRVSPKSFSPQFVSEIFCMNHLCRCPWLLDCCNFL